MYLFKRIDPAVGPEIERVNLSPRRGFAVGQSESASQSNTCSSQGPIGESSVPKV